jgi:hypothetical protein
LNLTTHELAHARPRALYVTEKCYTYGKLLNQTLIHTIEGEPEVSCFTICRDFVLFEDWHGVAKHASPGVCPFCGAPLQDKRRDAMYRSDKCHRRVERKIITTGQPGLSQTAPQ